jgi:peptidoglycan hydrolase-like protein with peptidoglycan-binding domain
VRQSRIASVTRFPQEARMKKLVIFIIATLSVAALAAVSATGANAQSSPQNQAQRAAADVNMEALPTLAADGVRIVQLALQKRGINPGPIDGVFGPLTKEAVRSFQSRYGIKASGEINNQTLFALGEVDLAI